MNVEILKLFVVIIGLSIWVSVLMVGISIFIMEGGRYVYGIGLARKNVVRLDWNWWC